MTLQELIDTLEEIKKEKPSNYMLPVFIYTEVGFVCCGSHGGCYGVCSPAQTVKYDDYEVSINYVHTGTHRSL